MTPYYPDLLARQVPRYTSYPTAAEFTGAIGPADMGEALDSLTQDDPVSLYVHIPFCREICAYCGCNTGRANRTQRLQSYIEALDSEIDLVAEALAGRGRVTRIAFGGGSPNALEPLAFVRLVDRLLTRFGATSLLFSVELDPRSLDGTWHEVIASLGIQRASLGVQSFSSAIQQAIGRIQPDRMIMDAVEGLRRGEISSLNFDLMYGLPGQSLIDLADSVERSIALGADRIALFGYAHLPSLLHRQRVIDPDSLPGTRLRFDQAALGRRLLVEAGYRPVGFDHFARPADPLAIAADSGRLHRNFQGFTDDDSAALIGIGASAISRFGSALLQNEKQAGRYRMLLGSGLHPAQRGIRLTAEMRARAKVIEQLLCHGRAVPGAMLLGSAMPTLRPLIERGLVRMEGPELRLAEQGWPYARLVAAAFDAFRSSGEARFSRAV